jgi:hypothetical protein
MVAPITVSPARLAAGIGSPVTMDSSTAEEPDTTTASTGIFSPGTNDQLVPWYMSRFFGLPGLARRAYDHRQGSPGADAGTRRG